MTNLFSKEIAMISLLQTTAIDGLPEASSLGGLDDLLGIASVLFVLFIVVATVAEQIIELFRGFLEGFGITLLKGGLTLEQAQKIAAEVLPENGIALAKVNALVALGDQYKVTLEKKKSDIEALRKKVSEALGPDLSGQIGTELKSEVTSMATEVRIMVEGSEAKRVYVLRLLSCAVCCVLCYFADFNAFAIADGELGPPSAGADGASQARILNFKFLNGLPGEILTGFAAASGSSYWHDALDKIRAAKQSIGQMQKVVSA
jgi:hypothetical protein